MRGPPRPRRAPSLARVAHTAGWLARHPGDLREVPAWYRSMRGGRALDAASPWLTFSALRWLEAHMDSTMRVFEWGCGGSTLYFARRVGELISVEHDPVWHAEVQRALAREARLPGRQELHLVVPETAGPRGDRPSGPPGSAPSYRSEREPGRNFHSYAALIDGFEERAFDLVLVDGRARNACIAHAIPRVRPGGWLMLDNAEREHYDVARERLAGYERLDLAGLGPWAPTPWLTCAWRIG